MTERLTEAQIRLIKPAIRARLAMPDDCDGCFDPLGNESRVRLVSYPVPDGDEPQEAGYHFQHRTCFENGVPVRRRLSNG